MGLLAVGACGDDAAEATLSQSPAGPTLDALDRGDGAGPGSDTAADTGRDGADGRADGGPDEDARVDADAGADADTTGGLAGAGEPCDRDADCLVGACVATREGMFCAATCAIRSCPDGERCRAITGAHGDAADVCVDPLATLCLPCDEHADCNLQPGGDGDNRCVDYGDPGRFCAVACGPGSASPEGTACGADGQCRAPVATCVADACTPLAVGLDAFAPCAASNVEGSCKGVRRCTDEGLGACDARAPSAEVCNGVDDDCDGATDGDEAAADCGGYACGGAEGCLTACAGDADCAPGLTCEGGAVGEGACVPSGADGSPCDEDEDCDGDHCDNGRCCADTGAPCCALDRECEDLDEEPECLAATAMGCEGTQIVGRCEGFACVERSVTAPEACAGSLCDAGVCADGTFHPPGACAFDGTCAPTGEPRVCDDGDPCTTDVCAPDQGCIFAAESGLTDAACYGHDAAARGVGACVEGVVSCDDGQVAGCVGDVAPSGEVCDGVDNDCDGVTDDGVRAECDPFACGGADGCLEACERDADCAEGAVCEAEGCRSLGGPGASCEISADCVSGVCDAGICCDDAPCCRADVDCAALDARVCDEAGAAGCAGTRVEGFCTEGFQCDEREVSDPGACADATCVPAVCDDAVTVAPARRCDAAGACPLADAPVVCDPFRCEGGACRTSCASDAECAPEAECVGPANAQVCRATRSNGDACDNDGQCASGHCDNGICCNGGICCSTQGDCAVLDEPPVCDDAEDCEGHRVVGVCGTESFRCTTETRDDPAACAGATCDDPECANLSGGGAILEGVARSTCDVGGACQSDVRDCRDAGGTAYCTTNPGFYSWCEGCESGDDTCVVFASPCYCE